MGAFAPSALVEGGLACPFCQMAILKKLDQGIFRVHSCHEITIKLSNSATVILQCLFDFKCFEIQHFSHDLTYTLFL